jgi:hypothetical protein
MVEIDDRFACPGTRMRAPLVLLARETVNTQEVPIGCPYDVLFRHIALNSAKFFEVLGCTHAFDVCDSFFLFS